MITLQNLSYQYKKGTDSLSGINGEIGSGIHLLLGANGAGKSTLLRIMAGLQRPTTGSCKVDGIESALRSPEMLTNLIMQTDGMQPPFTTVKALVRRHSVFYPSFNPDILEANLNDFGLSQDDRIDRMSLGNRRKALLAYLFALQTKTLLLDEPANGLDISAKTTLQRIILRCTPEDATLIISTHTVDDLKSLFDHVIMMDGGKILLNSTIWDITSVLDFNTVMSDSASSDALFSDVLYGITRMITPNTTGEPRTEIDIKLLYNALLSPSRQAIIDRISGKESHIVIPAITSKQ